MYAEDKRFFPDDLPATLEAADKLWLGYSAKDRLADLTWWGPRDRLRCTTTSQPGGVITSGGGNGKREIVTPGAAVRCLERVRSALGPAARLFVAVDAPKLQAIIFDELGARAFITPGVGVDPTNEFRDDSYGKVTTGGKGGNGRRGMYRDQLGVGGQDLAEQNLIKVSLDYFVQGFCLSSMTLRPSAFYGAAALRTSAVRTSIWRNVSAARRSDPGPCMSGFDGTQTMGSCQRTICGISSCNLHQ